MLRHQKREIGQRDRQRHLDQGNAPHASDQPHEGARHDEANDDAAQEDLQETEAAAQQIRLHIADDHGGQDVEQHDGGRIVEQALALHQHSQSLRCTEILEDGHDRHRIGRRQDRAQQQADQKAHARYCPDRTTDHEGGDQQTNDCQEQDRANVRQQLPDIDGQTAFEDQRRQEDENDDLRGDLQRLEAVEQVADHPQVHGMGQFTDQSQPDAHRSQQDRVGKPDTLRQRQHQHRYRHQAEQAEYSCPDTLMHRAIPP